MVGAAVRDDELRSVGAAPIWNALAEPASIARRRRNMTTIGEMSSWGGPREAVVTRRPLSSNIRAPTIPKTRRGEVGGVPKATTITIGASAPSFFAVTHLNLSDASLRPSTGLWRQAERSDGRSERRTPGRLAAK